jgi:nitrogen regulatory protein P-II 2
MNTHPMKLVTVICEALAREHLTRLLSDIGAHGYTLFPVEGEGSQGRRPGDIAEFANIQVQVVMQPAVAEQLLTRLQTEFFPRFAMIAYATDIQVLRPHKF